ncbi:MAG: hypothetical protein WAW52_11050 [Methanothrix sp.]
MENLRISDPCELSQTGPRSAPLGSRLLLVAEASGPGRPGLRRAVVRVG